MYTIGDYKLYGRLKSSKSIFAKRPYNELPLVMLLILLKGGFAIEKVSISKKIDQSIDYTILGTESCLYHKLSNYIINMTTPHGHQKLSDNFNFYRAILIEFCACLHAEKHRLGVLSMLHIYRILERMSYALPLLYAKNSDDFRHTYATMKSFFDSTDSKFGELGFFKKSLSTILDPTEKSFKFAFELARPEKEALSLCFKGLNQDTFLEDVGLVSFDLSMFETVGLLINTRNSFFHALSGQQHITLEKLVEPDTTFLKLTHNFINALSFLIAKISEPTLLPGDGTID